MQKARLFVLTSAEPDMDHIAKLCTVAAERDLYLSVMILGQLPTLPNYTIGMGSLAGAADYGNWQNQIEEKKQALSKVADALKTVLGKGKIPHAVNVLTADLASLPDALSHHTLTCDMVVLTNDLRTNKEAFDQAMLACLFRGTAGVVLNSHQSDKPVCPKRVMVGWNDGLQGSRAVRAAMPMLLAAEEIIVAVFDTAKKDGGDKDDPAADVALWLDHKGCNVSVQHYPSGGLEIGKAMMERAKEADADMVVMGAYDHSRMRQIIFGGTTRTMVEQTTLPVMLAH